MSRKLPLLIIAITLTVSVSVGAQTRVGARDHETMRAQSIEEVRTMFDRVLSFQDSEVKIRTMISLADLLWTRGQDEQGARPLFLKADELLRSVRTSRSDGTVASEKDRDVAVVSPKVLLSLKTFLVQKASAHDPSLGQRLGREYGLDTGNPSDLAYQDNFEMSSLIKSGQLASATKSLQRRIEDNLSGMQSLLSFLDMLAIMRAQDAQAADRLFIEATLRMSGLPNATADDILIIGNYLFASRFSDARALESRPKVGTTPIKLGEVVVRADLSKVRPGISNDAARTYLSAATQVLGRATYDTDEMMRRAAAASLLAPLAQTLAPEFAPQLSSIQSKAGIDLSYSPPTRTELPLAQDGKVDLGSVSKAVDAIPTSKLRDQYVLKVFGLLYSKGDLEAASAVGEKMSDLNARHDLVSLINFARGVKSLEAGQIENTKQSVKAVTTSLQRFLLRLGLARVYLRQQDKPAAEALLNEAIDDLRSHGDELQQPYLILAAVEMLASSDARNATDRLKDAVKAFNNLKSPRSARVGPPFWETVTVADKSTMIMLRISGVNYGRFVPALKSLAADPQGVRAALLEIRDESILSEAMLAFANTLSW